VSRDHERNFKISYLLLLNKNGDEEVFSTKDTFSEDWVKNFIGDLQVDLKEVSSINFSNNDERCSAFKNFISICRVFFRDLIPKELRDEINSWKSGTILYIRSEEQIDFIPWEILHDDKDFLGNRFIIIRQLDPNLIDDNDDDNDDNILLGANFNSSMIFQHIRTLIHVIGGNLGNKYEAKARSLYNDFFLLEDCSLISSFDLQSLQLSVPSPNGVSLNEFCSYHVLNIEKKPLTNLIDQTDHGDILHFTCHGMAYGHGKSRRYLQISNRQNSIVNLRLQSIEDPDFKIKKGCLVFANACCSDSAQPKVGGFTTFGEVFLSKGARYFIGTIGTIPVKYAIRFSYYFYKELFKREQNIPTAFINAKRLMKSENIVFHVLYVLYGDPMKA
jgi:hypothetical protein